jgi:hypothetical protein
MKEWIMLNPKGLDPIIVRVSDIKELEGIKDGTRVWFIDGDEEGLDCDNNFTGIFQWITG